MVCEGSEGTRWRRGSAIVNCLEGEGKMPRLCSGCSRRFRPKGKANSGCCRNGRVIVNILSLVFSHCLKIRQSTDLPRLLADYCLPVHDLAFRCLPTCFSVRLPVCLPILLDCAFVRGCYFQFCHPFWLLVACRLSAWAFACLYSFSRFA